MQDIGAQARIDNRQFECAVIMLDSAELSRQHPQQSRAQVRAAQQTTISIVRLPGVGRIIDTNNQSNIVTR